MGRRSGLRLYAAVSSLGIGAALLVGAGILPTLRHERPNTESGQYRAQDKRREGQTHATSEPRQKTRPEPPDWADDVCSAGPEQLPLRAVVPPALSSSGELGIAVIVGLLCDQNRRSSRPIHRQIKDRDH